MISISFLFKFIFIATGIFCAVRSILSLSKRVMSDFICLWWCVIALACIVFGLVFDPKPLDALNMGYENAIILILAWCLFMEGVFYLTTCLSKVERQNRELAMQVALLRDDVERMSKEIATLEGEVDGPEEAAVRHQHDGLRGSRDSASKSA